MSDDAAVVRNGGNTTDEVGQADGHQGAADTARAGVREEGQPESALSIIFAARGSAEFQLQMRQVLPTQMLAAGQWLVAHATRLLNDQWTMQARQQAQQQAELAKLQALLQSTVQ